MSRTCVNFDSDTMAQCYCLSENDTVKKTTEGHDNPGKEIQRPICQPIKSGKERMRNVMHIFFIMVYALCIL